jgi:hypothetical protein
MGLSASQSPPTAGDSKSGSASGDVAPNRGSVPPPPPAAERTSIPPPPPPSEPTASATPAPMQPTTAASLLAELGLDEASTGTKAAPDKSKSSGSSSRHHHSGAHHSSSRHVDTRKAPPSSANARAVEAARAASASPTPQSPGQGPALPEEPLSGGQLSGADLLKEAGLLDDVTSVLPEGEEKHKARAARETSLKAHQINMSDDGRGVVQCRTHSAKHPKACCAHRAFDCLAAKCKHDQRYGTLRPIDRLNERCGPATRSAAQC